MSGIRVLRIRSLLVPNESVNVRCFGSIVHTASAGSRADTQIVSVPSTESKHPDALERVRVRQQNAKHFDHCVELLNKAVWNVNPREALVAMRTNKRIQLSLVNRSVIDQAISTLPSTMQHDVRQAYENRIKVNQQSHYGIPKTTTPVIELNQQSHNSVQPTTPVKARKSHRNNIDDRFIALRGTVTLSNGEQCQFQDCDGTKQTLLRVAWNNSESFSNNAIGLMSRTDNVRKLALVLKDSLCRSVLSKNYSLCFNIADGNVISGKHAGLLRERGLELRVVHLPGELDYKAKRVQELERRKSKGFRLKKLQNILSPTKTNFKLKRPRSALHFYMQSRIGNLLSLQGGPYRLSGVRETFHRLTAQERKEYEDKAEADRHRFETERAERRSAANPKTSYQIFCTERSAALVQQDPHKYAGQAGQAKLAIDIKSEWLRLGRGGWLEYEKKGKRDAEFRSEDKTQEMKNLSPSQNHLDRSLSLLGKAVQDVDTQEALRAHGLRPRSWLRRVSPSVVAAAIASLPTGLQADARLAYDNHIGESRAVLDVRFVAIRGTATLSNGEQCHFQDYDGTDNTLMRFAWDTGSVYACRVSIKSSNNNVRNLALLVNDLNRVSSSSTQCNVCVMVDDDNIIKGKKVARLRECGLEMRVVQIPCELDYKSKRQQELERRRLLQDKHLSLG